MKLNKGTFYSRTLNVSAGIKLNKGQTYISVWYVSSATVHTGAAIGYGIGLAIVAGSATGVWDAYCITVSPREWVLTEAARGFTLTEAERGFTLKEVTKCGN